VRVVEVDGGQHGFDDHQAYDAARTAALEARGFRVLRFSNAPRQQKSAT
jgi:very-short-patch-repair endonuclease